MNQTILRRILGASLILLAAASMYLSWGALYEFALASGFPPERAIVFPVILDIVVVVSMVLAITVAEGKRYAWVTLSLFGFATVAGNALHVTTLPATAIMVSLPVAIIASAIPPVALLMVTHLAAVTVYRPRVTAVVTGVTDLRPQVTALHESGQSVASIARVTGVARSTVVRWLKTA